MDATVISLNCWQDPQGDIVLNYSERECSIYFGCWSSSGEPADSICHLSFRGASAVRSYRREFIPYRIPEHPGHSFILRIPDSEFLRDHVAYRQQHYPSGPAASLDRRHFVVIGHDIYFDILAADFSEETIPAATLTDERLLALHRNA